MSNSRKSTRKAVKAEFSQPHPALCNDDFLKHIFEYLPTLKNVNLVCKQFNEIASDISEERQTDWLRILDEFDIDDQEKYDSMMNTKRIFSKAAVGESNKVNEILELEIGDSFLNEEWYFNAVLSVIGIKHGDNLKVLQLMNVQISMTNLLRLLIYIPSLKFLKLFFCNNSMMVKKARGVKDNDLITRLPEISDLILVSCGSSTQYLINFLHVNCLKSLTFEAKDLEKLKELLVDQKAIKKMTLICKKDSAMTRDALDNISLTHFIVKIKNNRNLSQVIASQPDLIFLDTSAMLINNDMFLEIMQLQKLQELRVNVSWISRTLEPNQQGLQSSLLCGASLRNLKFLLNGIECCMESLTIIG